MCGSNSLFFFLSSFWSFKMRVTLPLDISPFHLWMIFLFPFLALAAFDAIVLTRSHLFLGILCVCVCGVVLWILAKEFILCANKECAYLRYWCARFTMKIESYMVYTYKKYMYTWRANDRYMKYGLKFIVKINNNQTKSEWTNERMSVFVRIFILFRVQPWASNEYGVLKKRHSFGM